MPGKAAFGTKLRMGVTPVDVANITKISGPDFSAETLDVTSHDSAGKYREIVPSFLSAGEVMVSLNFDPTKASHKNTAGGLLKLFEDRTIEAFKIVFPDTTEAAFNAYVTNFKTDAEFDKKLEAQVRLTLSGGVTWTYPA